MLPLDGGETVLPLDGGETVLPLGDPTDKLITSLLDGGETVLPLNELTVIRAAYQTLATSVTPSQKLLLQPGFRKIGLYPVVGKATGRGVVIADLDTGADACHEALRGIVLYTFVEGPDANAPENCPTSSTVAVSGRFTVFEIAPEMKGWTEPIILMWPMWWIVRTPFPGLNAQSKTARS